MEKEACHGGDMKAKRKADVSMAKVKSGGEYVQTMRLRKRKEERERWTKMREKEKEEP